MPTLQHFRSLLGPVFVILMLAGGSGCGAPGEEALGDQTGDIGEQAAAVVTTCPDPKSCAGWSVWYNEGAPFCQTGVAGCGAEICLPCHCGIDTCQECCHVGPGPATEQLQQSFRQCTLQNGQSCRETREQTIQVKCGC